MSLLALAACLRETGLESEVRSVQGGLEHSDEQV